MKKYITLKNISHFAYTNHEIVKKPVRRVVLSFSGLGNTSTFFEGYEIGERYAAEGVLFVYPYNNPWAWMNRQAIAFTDEILDVLFEGLGLDPQTPIVSTGKSMGGLSALVYTCYAKRTPTVTVANCPVCDLPYHLTERKDLPRTLYSAFWHEEGEMDEVLRTFSPLHLTQKMPDGAYYIFHCTADKSVNKELHSDKFVTAMQKTGKTVVYHAVEGRGHCSLPYEMNELFFGYTVNG